MISPLLLGTSSASSAVNSPVVHPHSSHPKSSAAPPVVSAFSKAAAALNNAAAAQQEACAAAALEAQNMSRAMSYNSGLTEYVNKMKISEAGSPAAPEPASVGNAAAAAAAGKRSKLSNESTLSSSSSVSAMSIQSSRSAGAPAAPMPHISAGQTNAVGHSHSLHHAHSLHTPNHHQYPTGATSQLQAQQSAPVSASHQPGNPLNSHAYASNLDRLLEAARYCQLPQSGRPLQPMPADPLANPHHGPTIPLVVSPNLPPRMQRPQWRLSDYALGDKLYTGYASTVYKAVCRASCEVVVLKIYHLMSVCDLYKYQIYREVRVHSNLCHENIVHLYAAFQVGRWHRTQLCW